MRLIDNLSADASQLTRLVLADGSLVTFKVIYRPAVQRWTVDVTWGTFTANGLNLCVGPNVLREWRDVLPFGLACITTDGVDPVYLEDFANGRAQLYLLDASEVEGVEVNVMGAP